MIREKQIKKEEEIDELYKIITEEIGIELNSKTRKREVVHARIVFAKILLDAGHKPDDITDKVNIHRTLIYHYKKTFWEYYTKYKFINNLYEFCKIEFEGHIVPEKVENKKSLISYSKKLEKKVI